MGFFIADSCSSAGNATQIKKMAISMYLEFQSASENGYKYTCFWTWVRRPIFQGGQSGPGR